jgi:hypothetical protein
MEPFFSVSRTGGAGMVTAGLVSVTSGAFGSGVSALIAVGTTDSPMTTLMRRLAMARRENEQQLGKGYRVITRAHAIRNHLRRQA